MSEGASRLVGLHGNDEAARLLACEELIVAGAPLTPPQSEVIDRMLAGSQPRERFAAARVLARCGALGHDVGMLVAAALAEEHALLRSTLIRTVERAVASDQAAREAAIHAILVVLGDRGSTPRCRAAELVARVPALAGHEGLLAALGGLLADDSGPTRVAALVALGALGGGAALIAPLLADPQIDVAREALRALLRLDPAAEPALGALVRALRGERPGLEVVAVEGLVEAASRGALTLPPVVGELLVGILRSSVEMPLREAACDAIGLLGGLAEAETLASLLHEPVWGLRSALIDALFAMQERGVGVVDVLLPRLDEGPIGARIEMLQAIGSLGKTDPRVRQRILSVALQETRHAPRDTINHALREAACHALSLCGGPDEALALVPHVDLSSPVMMRRRAMLAARAVCVAMLEGSPPAPPPEPLLAALSRTLTDPDDQCRRHACECYCVLAAGKDEALRAAARRALPGLMRRLCERLPRISGAARLAMTRLGPLTPLDSALVLAVPPGFGALVASLAQDEGWSPALRGELARILVSRIRWLGDLLELPAPAELPTELPALAELLGERARQFGTYRKNCGGPGGALLREQAWVIAQAYTLLAR
jgi:hypothetical protein